MTTWIYLTLAAAFLQNVRSLLQRQLATNELTVNGATYVRFLYALPFACLYVAVLFSGTAPPVPNAPFWLYASTGAIAQMLGTAALIGSFKQRNFAVGTAYSKTEVVQTALFGVVLLGEVLSWRVGVGMLVSFVGVYVLAVRIRLAELLKPGGAVGLGLLAGAGIALSAVCYRGAALALDTGSVVERAALVLAIALFMQSTLMGAYLTLRQPGTVRSVLGAWRTGVWVGLSGMLASAAWFTAMTIQNAALVRAVGQVELIFAFLTSVWLFHERVTARETAGAALIVAGIYLLLL